MDAPAPQPCAHTGVPECDAYLATLHEDNRHESTEPGAFPKEILACDVWKAAIALRGHEAVRTACMASSELTSLLRRLPPTSLPHRVPRTDMLPFAIGVPGNPDPESVSKVCPIDVLVEAVSRGRHDNRPGWRPSGERSRRPSGGRRARVQLGSLAVGLAFGGFAGAKAVAQPFGGWAVDWLCARSTAVSGLIVAAAATAALAPAGRAGEVIGYRLLWGVGAGFAIPARYRLASTLGSRSVQARLGWFGSAAVVGMTLGPSRTGFKDGGT